MRLYQKRYYRVDNQDRWFQRYIKRAWYLLSSNRLTNWKPANLGKQRSKPTTNRTGKERYL